MNFEPVIGLEVHVQLKTKSKLFCPCPTTFGEEGNRNTCRCVWGGQVASVVNEEALKLAIRAGLALQCQVAERIKFDRKNYFYPDLPKAYQISQYDMPVNGRGYVDVETKIDNGTDSSSGSGATTPERFVTRRIGITRSHLRRRGQADP